VLVDVAGIVFFADIFHDAVREVVLGDHVHEALGAVVPDFAAVCLFQIRICSLGAGFTGGERGLT
jgi:hypothetical protein